MTEGISKEYLENSIKTITEATGIDETSRSLMLIVFNDLLERCYELDPWMPIESAPKDGEEIQLCSLFDQAVCYWRDDEIMTGWTWGWENKFFNPIGWKKLSELPLPYKLLPEDPK